MTHLIKKATLALSGLFLLCCTAFAAGKDDFKALSQLLKGRCIQIEYSYVFASGQNAIDDKGVLVYQDGLYTLKGKNAEIYCDGTRRVVLDRANKEAVSGKSSATDFLSDPEGLASLFGADSDAQVDISSPDGGKTISGISISLKDGSMVDITIISMQFLPQASAEDFSFDVTALDKSWVVTVLD